jgi:hypothetical protein
VSHIAWDVTIDPEIWTLSGLDMPIGQAVVDVRIKRRVGYWDGRRLTENPPRRARPRQ